MAGDPYLPHMPKGCRPPVDDRQPAPACYPSAATIAATFTKAGRATWHDRHPTPAASTHARLAQSASCLGFTFHSLCWTLLAAARIARRTVDGMHSPHGHRNCRSDHLPSRPQRPNLALAIGTLSLRNCRHRTSDCQGHHKTNHQLLPFNRPCYRDQPQRTRTRWLTG